MSAMSFWRLLFTLNLVLLVLLGVSFPFQQPGSASRTISLLGFLVIGASLLGLGLLIRIDWDPF